MIIFAEHFLQQLIKKQQTFQTDDHVLTKHEFEWTMVIIFAEYFCAISPAISIPTAPPPMMITFVALSIYNSRNLEFCKFKYLFFW